MTDGPHDTILSTVSYRIGEATDPMTGVAYRMVLSLEREADGPDPEELLRWLRTALIDIASSSPDLVAQDLVLQLRHREHWPGERRYRVEVWRTTELSTVGTTFEGVL